jgi:hypothetical protein
MTTRDGGEGELVGVVDGVLKGSDGRAGELHGITAKLWEGLSWIRRGCRGLPTVSRACRRRRMGGDGGFEARGEMRMQERAKWREGSY